MIKMVFISNFFNHHQKPFSDSMYSKLNGNFSFIETSDIDEERKKLGWNLTDYPEYVFNFLRAPEKCKEIINNSDVIILGSAPYSLINDCLKKRKLTFLYSERIYKNGYNRLKLPVRMLKNYKKFGRYKNMYLLCASAYAYNDYLKTFNFINRAYKWGYFPEYIEYGNISHLIEKKEKNQILWCGRLIDWKHPERAVDLAINLKNHGYEFKLLIIGTGPLEEKIKLMIKQNSLEDCVNILGSMSPKAVRKYMEQSQIFIFTSDKKEGWGAVVNEAMNSACGIVANNAPGSVPFLIKDRVNGIIYDTDEEDSLFVNVKYLLDNQEILEKISKQAYLTISSLWNSDVASTRIIRLSEVILNNDLLPNLFSEGPCSKAEKINE